MIFRIASLLVLFGFSGCQSISIDQVIKRTASPGLPGQSITTGYQATIMIEKPLQLTSIASERTNETISFAITRLPDGLMLSQTDVLDPGKYFVNGSTGYSEEHKNHNDTLLFTFLNEQGKSIVIKKTTTIGSNLLRK